MLLRVIYFCTAFSHFQTSGQQNFVEVTNCGTTEVDIGDYFIYAKEVNSDSNYFFFGLGADEIFSPGDVLVFYPNQYPNGTLAVMLADRYTGDTVDEYGVPRTDGAGQVWEYTNSYSYRKPGSGPSNTFDASQWIFGGANLWNAATTAADIAAVTTPGRHACLPTSQPIASPSALPSAKPSQKPSAGPTLKPSLRPSKAPSQEPSSAPSTSTMPSFLPSQPPTKSAMPSRRPTTIPSARPSGTPSGMDGAGCNNITIRNFRWKWILCLLWRLFGRK
jgi:hypothetical protein